MSQLITPHSLKDLVDANVHLHATVIAEQGTFKINVNYADIERTVSVRSRSGQVKERVFTSLDSAARFMRDKIHLSQFEVNATNFDPTPKSIKRPDTAKRMSAAHAALSHSEWAQQKVQAARDGIANGNNQRIEADDWAEIRAAKRQQLDAL